MNFPWRRPKCLEEKGNFPGSNVFSLKEGQSALRKKANSSRSNVFSLRKDPSSFKNNHVSNCFVITTISCWFFYKLANYHWKGFNDGYNSMVGSVSIGIHMKNLKSHKVSDTFAPSGHMVGPEEQRCPLGRKGLKLPWEQPRSLGNKSFQNFVWSYLVHMNSDWSASNYKVVALIETLPMIGCKLIQHVKIEITKWFGTWLFPKENTLLPKEVSLLPRVLQPSSRHLGPPLWKIHCPLKDFSLLLGELFKCPKEKGNFYGEQWIYP